MISPDQEKLLRKAWRDGKSPKAIGRLINRSWQTVHYHARRLELPNRQLARGRRNDGLSSNLAVPLTAAMLEAVRQRATIAGMGMGTMVRQWIEEKLK